MNYLALTEGTWALLIGQGVIFGALVLKAIVDQLDKIQDRADRAQVADLTLKQVQKTNEDGEKRGQKIINEIVKENVKTRGVSVHQIKVGNNINKKLEDLGLKQLEIIAAASVDSAKPLEVQVMNGEGNSIPTRNIPDA